MPRRKKQNQKPKTGLAFVARIDLTNHNLGKAYSNPRDYDEANFNAYRYQDIAGLEYDGDGDGGFGWCDFQP